VPLIYKTRLAGLLLLADKISRRPFNSDEIEFVSALGNQISVAIENARLYEAEKAANEQLWAAQQQVARAERLAALGEMSAKIAHEVNNPLGIIKNYLVLMQRAESGDAKVEEYLEIVSQEIDRIAKIVVELRQFRRPDRLEFSVIDLAKVLESTLTLAVRQLNSGGIDLVREFPEGPLLVKGNADHLRQVFLNLILNARDIMPKGGALTVKLGIRDGQAFVLFQDTGPGVSPKALDKIFEPFFTTKGKEGSGLGLSICDGIMKTHKGSITFKNVPGGGCFEICLPLLGDQ
jgi:signal transduction histidine kinase